MIPNMHAWLTDWNPYLDLFRPYRTTSDKRLITRPHLMVISLQSTSTYNNHHSSIQDKQCRFTSSNIHLLKSTSLFWGIRPQILVLSGESPTPSSGYQVDVRTTLRRLAGLVGLDATSTIQLKDVPDVSPHLHDDREREKHLVTGIVHHQIGDRAEGRESWGLKARED